MQHGGSGRRYVEVYGEGKIGKEGGGGGGGGGRKDRDRRCRKRKRKIRRRNIVT